MLSSAGLATADNLALDGDQLTGPASVSLGDICAGETVSTGIKATLTRHGGGVVFANGAMVTISAVASEGASLSTATLGPLVDWVTYDSKGNIDSPKDQGETYSGDLDVTVAVPEGAETGSRSAQLSVQTSGTLAVGKNLPSAPLTITWNVVGCTPADATPPKITPTVSGEMGDNEWHTSDVFVSWTVVDEESAITSPKCESVTVSQDTTGRTITCSATSAGGGATESVTIKRDATPPVVTLVDGPQDGASYWFGDVPAAPTCTSSDATSGLRLPSPGCAVSGYSTALADAHVVTATARDEAGNAASDVASYAVKAWNLTGFFRPVDGGAIVNVVKGGSTVPLKFSLAKDTPVTDLAAGSYEFKAFRMTCGGTAAESFDQIEEYGTGKTVLRYDADGAQWIQNWATPRVDAKTCYKVVFSAGGASAEALFELRK